jgi:ubiquinone/menaquinone biosynthesis C-methylase UbiE
MKVRESGMPNEKIWKEFFEPESVLCILELNHNVTDVVEFGSGYGTFTVPAAKTVTGIIYAIDIEEEMIKRVAERASEEKLNNIKIMLRDFVNEGSGLEDRSVDYAMLFNILHAEKPKELLKEAYRILKPGEKLGVIHWNYDPETPRSPPMTIRTRPEQCIKWAIEVGFNFENRHDLESYYYGLVFSKPDKE